MGNDPVPKERNNIQNNRMVCIKEKEREKLHLKTSGI